MKTVKILMLVAFIMTTQVALAQSNVIRTIEGNNYTYSGNIATEITVVLNGTDGNFSSPGWGVVETLPERTNVVVLSLDTTVTHNEDDTFTFVKIGSGNIKYNITELSNVPRGIYYIIGTFVDADKNNGTISFTQFRVVENIIDRYDRDGNRKIEKGEAIDAVFDYFNTKITLDEVVRVVKTYLGL